MSPMNSAGGGGEVGPGRMSVADVVDWVQGKLSPDEAAVVEAAVAEGDEYARSTLLCAQRFLAAAEEVHQVRPPPGLRQALLDMFRPSPPRQVGAGIVQRIAAVLTSDSWAGVAPAGLRGDAAGRDRHLAYSSPAADVVLDVSPAPRGHVRIDGQVLPNLESDDVFYVQIVTDDVEAAITLCDDVGEFTFEGLAPGSYRLVVGTGQAEIIVEPVELAS